MELPPRIVRVGGGTYYHFAPAREADFLGGRRYEPVGIARRRATARDRMAGAGMKVFLEFEGIKRAGEFYLNGRHVGRHENGITAFGFDVTDLLKPAPEENVIAARIDNAWDYKERATGSAFTRQASASSR